MNDGQRLELVLKYFIIALIGVSFLLFAGILLLVLIIENYQVFGIIALFSAIGGWCLWYVSGCNYRECPPEVFKAITGKEKE